MTVCPPAEQMTVSPPADQMTVSPPAEQTTVSPPAEQTTVSAPAEKTTVSAPAKKTASKPVSFTALERGDSLRTIDDKIEACNAKIHRLRTKVEEDLATRMRSQTYEETLVDMDSSPRLLKLNKLIQKTNTELG